MSAQSVHRKTRAFAPQGFFACEAAGLRWMGAATAQGGPRVCKVIGVGNDYLDIENISSASPTRKAARKFGAQLARMHDAGAEFFGSAPAGYDGTCYFGPLQDPVPMDTGEWTSVIDYFADGRLRPMVTLGIQRGALTSNDLDMTNEIIEALPELLGEAADDTPARVHGDLWSGNLMWTDDRGETEAVLIDPAAHGGHREEDLAMLDLFGVSYQSEILDGYESEHPLVPGFRARFTLWQLYPIAGHCVFFGGGYVSQYRSMCRALLR
ncbi:MAG: fructosamine kinase family protein [Bifidobacteriaceae bacterium]|jgi:fructosamine-3-kinase|nr:fructosamine kinase family protein [Bifidobacteriaceae bacterium]